MVKTIKDFYKPRSNKGNKNNIMDIIGIILSSILMIEFMVLFIYICIRLNFQ